MTRLSRVRENPVIRAATHLASHGEFTRFVRFSVVGALGTVVDFGLLVVLKELFSFPTLMANTLSYSAGIINNFTLNRLWTYSDSREKRALVQLVQFAAVSIGGLLLNDGIVSVLEGPLGSLWTPECGYVLAKVVATGVVVFWNFVANRLWTFNDVE